MSSGFGQRCIRSVGGGKTTDPWLGSGEDDAEYVADTGAMQRSLYPFVQVDSVVAELAG